MPKRPAAHDAARARPPLQKAADDAFPTKQLTILAICRFSEPIAFNSILAYTYVMVQDLHGGDDTNASFYAGLLVSAYAVAEALTALFWGSVSDRVGRKPVVLLGLCGVALSSLLFGLAKRYWVALLARFVGGALNGNVAVMQTMVAEMVKKPEHEPRAYAVQPFVWFLGSIIGSALGGYLAQPAHFYPHIFPEDGLFGQYPYLLPNLVAVAVIVVAVVQGIFFLEETNPHFKLDDDAIDDNDFADERTPLRRAAHRASVSSRAVSNSRTRSIVESINEIRRKPSFLEEGLPTATEQRFDLRRSSFGTIHSIRLPNEHALPPRNPPPAPITARRTFNKTVIMLTISLVFVSYHQMAFGSILPVYLLDRPALDAAGIDLHGGLGYTVHDVGSYMAVNGVIALLIQALIFPVFVEKVGVWKSFLWMIILYPITYIIMPFLSALPEPLISPGVYGVLFLQNVFGIIAVPCALILLKNATPSSLVLGKVNGLAMSACCGARTVSPPLVGIFYSVGGSAAAWISCAVVAILGSVQLFWVPREHVDQVHVESAFKPNGTAADGEPAQG